MSAPNRSTPAGIVHWGSIEAGQLERLMAVLLAQDHPNAMRREPSSGDGGVDIFIPTPDGYIVHQVKGFAGRIDKGRKRQITTSWESLCDDPRLDGPIIQYWLSCPVKPTSGEYDWFKKLTAGAEFPRDWLGEPYWDSMAAKHPHVIDYMLGGGVDRVLRRTHALLGVGTDGSTPITADDVAASLETMRNQLNSEDPHYQYAFAQWPTRPTDEQIGSCVMAEVRSLADGGYLSISVHAKHAYSLVDAPIEVKFTITPPAGDPGFADAVNAHLEYGRELHIPDGALSGEMTGPIGLGGTIEISGRGYIGPSLNVDAKEKRSRLVLLDTAGETVAEIGLETKSVTQGQAGGTELKATDATGLFTMAARIPPGGDGAHFDFHLDDVVGRPVVDVIELARFTANLRAGYELQWRLPYGTKVVAAAVLDEDQDLLSRQGLRHLEDLAFAQGFADGPIVVPEEFEPEVARYLRRTVRMLEGETETGTWTDATLTLNPDHTRADALLKHHEPHQMLMVQRRGISFDNGTVADFGDFTTIWASMVAAVDQPDDETQLAVVPGADPSYTARAGSHPGLPGEAEA